VPAPVITLALLQRLRSRDEQSFADRLLAAMRQQFGGHAVKEKLVVAPAPRLKRSGVNSFGSPIPPRSPRSDA
jgi:hypothetical protein